jgi:hypothetical protein
MRSPPHAGFLSPGDIQNENQQNKERRTEKN